jgi:hypothetical protein
MSVGRDKGKGKMTLSEIEAWKERENQERRKMHLQEAKEKIFPETWKRGAPEESESEDGGLEEDPGHGRVPCDACRARKFACEWSGTGRIKACDLCRGFRKSCRVNGVGHRAPSVKKAWVAPESEEEAGQPRTPAKARNPKAKRSSDGNGDRVGDREVGRASVEALQQLKVPLMSMARNARRAVSQHVELLEEFQRSQNILLDLVANLCTLLREIPYQLHVRNEGLEETGSQGTSEVSESVQQAPKLIESAEVGVQAGNTDIPEIAEVAGNAEVVEKVGTEGVGREDETMEDA